MGLYDDHRFPGRCLVVYRRHAEHLADLSDAEAHAFLDDVRAVGSAIRTLGGDAVRVNYAILGNAEPHLHAHLIPRVPGGDPLPDRPPWQHPQPRGPMSAEEIERWRTSLRLALTGHALHEDKPPG